MQINDFNNNQSYSLEKLPVDTNSDLDSFNSQKFSDKIKLLEFSNLIDKWEQELLFSENGFFSFKGKKTQEKAKEFIDELQNFSESVLKEMNFSLPESTKAASIIKKLKIDNISSEMNKYVSEQMHDWQVDTLSDALNLSIEKAVLYKNNPQLIDKSYQNAMRVFDLLAQIENWNDKTLSHKICMFRSDFYKKIIDDFIKDKNISCFQLFQKYKKFLLIDNLDEYEKQIISLKNNIVAYNWAKELFSYNLSDSENEKEINTLKDKNLELLVRNFLKLFKKQKIKNEDFKNNEFINSVWQNITDTLQINPEKALLYIDSSQKESYKKSQKEYIDKFLKNGSINTDFKQFSDLLQELSDDCLKFKEKNLNDLRHLFSNDDFDMFINFQKMNCDKLLILGSDISFIKTQLKKLKINSEEKFYSIFKIFYSESQLKNKNSDHISLQDKNKLINEILLRFSDK